MTLRPYTSADADQLLAIFRKNVPASFGEAEIEDYIDFLRTNNDPYFVVERADQVVGACGYYLIRERSAGRICWIFTDPDAHGSGVGSALMRYVLNQMLMNPHVALIECQTSQVSCQFFEKFGFVLQHTKPNHWAPGLDLYFMTLDVKGQ